MRIAWSLLLLCAACGSHASQEGGEANLTPWTEGQTRKGTTLVRWRPTDGTLAFNEYFSLDFELQTPATGSAVLAAELFVRCDMPAHGHGMNVEPKALELGDGRYRVDGMLLHMTGEWLLGVDVVIGGKAESVSFPLTLTLE